MAQTARIFVSHSIALTGFGAADSFFDDLAIVLRPSSSRQDIFVWRGRPYGPES